MHYQTLGSSLRIGIIVFIVFAVSIPILVVPEFLEPSTVAGLQEDVAADGPNGLAGFNLDPPAVKVYTAEVDLQEAVLIYGELMTILAESKEELSPPAQEVPDTKESLAHYRVERGDTLYWIARTYDTTVSELQRLNNLNGVSIQPGQALLVPNRTLQQYPAKIALTNGEVRWLAQMIHAEARGEPYLGQVAVGAVILNRIKSPQFPSTLRGVLFQPRAFQPIANGSFYRPANDMAYRAALEALNGHDPSKGSLFFFNPRQSSDRFMHARPAAVTIGQHRFMR